MKSKEEIESLLEVYEGDRYEPDPLTNRERRRVILWILDRDDEAEELQYKNPIPLPDEDDTFD